MEDERARFEAWVKKTSGLYPAKDEKGDYLTTIVWHWFAGWNAQSERIARLEEALKRIALAKPDRLDHSLDVAIIERAARIASDALESK